MLSDQFKNKGIDFYKLILQLENECWGSHADIIFHETYEDKQNMFILKIKWYSGENTISFEGLNSLGVILGNLLLNQLIPLFPANAYF